MCCGVSICLEYIELDSDIPTSSRGVYIFNGQTINRPANTKTIVQIKEGSTILLSAITGAGESLPVISANAAPITSAPAQNTEQTVTTNDTVEIANTSNGVAPWLWTGGVALAAGGSLATSSHVCGSLSFYCTKADPDFKTEADILPFQGINYGLLGFGAFSAYKMQQAFRANKSSAE